MKKEILKIIKEAYEEWKEEERENGNYDNFSFEDFLESI